VKNLFDVDYLDAYGDAILYGLLVHVSGVISQSCFSRHEQDKLSYMKESLQRMMKERGCNG